jgi:DNA primase
VRLGASPSDADLVLRQSLALHRRAGALHRDLKLAERLLATEPNDLNLARLLDIKTNLADLADAEAAIDGFGDQSGRISSAI